jgi:hypothetical protein
VRKFSLCLFFLPLHLFLFFSFEVLKTWS